MNTTTGVNMDESKQHRANNNLQKYIQHDSANRKFTHKKEQYFLLRAIKV